MSAHRHVGLGSPYTGEDALAGEEGQGKRGSLRRGRTRGTVGGCWLHAGTSVIYPNEFSAHGCSRLTPGPAHSTGPQPAPTPEQPPLAQKRANFHTAQSASLKGKSFPWESRRQRFTPSLAGCHRAQMWRAGLNFSSPRKTSPERPCRPSPQPKSQGQALGT